MAGVPCAPDGHGTAGGKMGLVCRLAVSQYKIAKSFEDAYYSVREIPDVARQVVLGAEQARSDHKASALLLRKFAADANRFVGAVIPAVKDAMGRSDIGEIREQLDTIITQSKVNSEETERTKERGREDYQQIIRHLSHVKEATGASGVDSVLNEAAQSLGEADRCMEKLSRFWGHMEVLVNLLKNEIAVGVPYLENLDDPSKAKMFQDIMDDSKEKWVAFEKICGHYVQVCESDPVLSIQSLYGFLDGPAGGMDQRACRARKREIRNELLAQHTIESLEEAWRSSFDFP